MARQLGEWLIAKAGSSQTRLIVLLMVVVCGLGATMSSTAVTAILILVALRIAQTSGTRSSRLMMPLSFAALSSRMTTLVATAPNLGVVNSELQRNGIPGFQFFSFTPFGVPVLILGIVYMPFACHWLTARHDAKSESFHRPSLADWIEEYQLASREHRVRVTESSPLVGQSLGEQRLRDTSGAEQWLRVQLAGTVAWDRPTLLDKLRLAPPAERFQALHAVLRR